MSNLQTTISTDENEYHLIGTYTRYSSWTARVETVLEYFKIPYTATFVPLSDVKSVSPTGFVPLFKVLSLSPSIFINDSLSICEFLAESHPEKPLWPQDRQLRALARSAVAEMHSGFSELRDKFGTNFIAKYTGDIPTTEQGRKEIGRMLKLWGDSRESTAERLSELEESDEGFLFGGFSIADAFFWPVLWRFRSYNLPLDGATSETVSWIRKMWNDPVLRTLSKGYFEQAKRPETVIQKYDDVFKENPNIQSGSFEEDWKFSL